MPAPRILSLILSLVLLASAGTARAQGAPPSNPAPSGQRPADRPRGAQASPAAEDEGETTPPAAPPAAPPAGRPGAPSAERDELKREVLDEVRRELDKTKDEIREEVAFVEGEAEARNYDAEKLRELRQTVNLLQLHGYFRGRGDLFKNADLGRGADPGGNTLFPVSPGSENYIGNANMRLRLNPVLRVSDDIALYGQFDVLDNVVAGSNPLAEPFFDPTTSAFVLGNRIAGQALQVKRLWAEIETPVGQIAFGRKGLHWGEGILYNDGNCLDCDYGTTFDRLQLTVGPLLKGHLFTVAGDLLSSGPTTNNVQGLLVYGNYGQPFPVDQLAAAYRFSLQITRMTPLADQRRKLDNGEWVFNYGLLGAYRFQHSEVPAFAANPSEVSPGNTPPAPLKIDAQLGEVDAYAQVLYRKLRLATEWATFFGRMGNRIAGGTLQGQALDFLQLGGILRGQYSFLKQDSLLIGVDLGMASGDKRPGMGARPGRPGSGPGGNTQPGDIDGPQFNCPLNAPGAECIDNEITNFTFNPDFRIDQLLWRNIFTRITDAWFARVEARFKPGGRASGGADDDGFEVAAAAVYSQAFYGVSTPHGSGTALGVETDVAVTYTSRDRFFAGLVAGFLFPFEGLQNPTNNETNIGQVYRGILGVTF